jgi:hypothetical protein
LYQYSTFVPVKQVHSVPEDGGQESRNSAL